MADGGRRLFAPSWIFQSALIICCICVVQGSENGVEYHIASPALWSSYSMLVRHARHHGGNNKHNRPDRAAGDEPVSTAAGPDSVTNGAGGQTLPDTPSGPAPSTAPPVISDTTELNPNVDSGGMDTTQTTTPAPTTPPPDPFKDADIIHDNHIYYTSDALNEMVSDYYVDVSTTKKHETLSRSHRVAAVIPLKFDFPFYGHPVKNVTVATGGFIYMSPFLHQWLTATQYIAPLMANFDPSFHGESNIIYLSEAEIFTVEWRQVYLQDQPELGNFTFQTSLYSNGSISFVYKNIPVDASRISDSKHPVKVGLSDAYYNDTYLPQYRRLRRTIYEYHQVSLKTSLVRTGAVIFVQPLPTCNVLNDCNSCTAHADVDFDCRWCNTIGRCSDGLDWYRQHWDRYGCNSLSTNESSECVSLPTPPKPIPHPIPPLELGKDKKCKGGNCGKGSDVPVAVIVVVILLVLGLIAGVTGWTYYAYTHPTSKSGMWLMEHRPSQIKAKIKFWKSSSSADSGAKYRAETDA